MSITSLQFRKNLAELVFFTVWTLLSFLFGFTAWLLESPAGKSIFDMLHWTSAFALSMVLAWRGMRLSEEPESTVLLWITLGAGLLFLGQLLWNIQVFIGWNPFPSPADLLFLAVGAFWLIGLMHALQHHLPADRVYSAVLDITGLILALLALVLTLYVPHGQQISLMALLVLVLYPVSFLSVAFFALFMIPGMALRFTIPHFLLISGIALYGFSWMQWNIMMLNESLHDGMLFNMLYAISALLLGTGARFWRICLNDDIRYRAGCERVMNHIPLLSMTLVLILLFYFFYNLQNPGIEQGIIFICCLLALLAIGVRQTHMLEVLERLRQAEIAINHNKNQIFQLANYDSLTGLPNKAFFKNHLNHVLQSAQIKKSRVAVILVDLDHFKHINEIYGNCIGDNLLCEVAARIQAVLDTHCTLARVGSDEFIIMVDSYNSRTELARLAEKILQIFHQPWTKNLIAGSFVSAGIGISLYPDDASNDIELMRNADLAAHHVKSNACGNYQFYLEEYTEITRKRLELTTLLHRAIPEQQLSVFYQPQVNIYGQITGAEALLRWTTQGKLISPDEFIPLAESSGLIIPIGTWVFRKACQQLTQWNKLGVNIIDTVSVNISAVQLREPGFVMQLVDIACEEGVSTQSIMLEITESEMLDDKVIPAAKKLREAGFSLSIDDFGTGQSSLVKLKKLPVSELKIDKEFVRDIADDEGDKEICLMILSLSRTLGLTVVAEGVETKEQFQLLKDMGCRCFQGWLFSPALDAHAFTQKILTSLKS